MTRTCKTNIVVTATTLTRFKTNTKVESVGRHHRTGATALLRRCTFFVVFCQSDLSLSSPCHNQQSMSGSGCHLMKSPDLINLNLTWALHEVLSLYEKDMVKFMIKLMKLSLKCKFGCSLYLKKSLSYLHLNFTYPRLFLWCWLQPYSHS